VCHHQTITEHGTRSRDAAGWSVYAPVPVAGYYRHVNGQPDVAFDPTPITFGDQFELSGAAYDPATRTCLSVSCHFAEGSVEWGRPYRWWNTYECNACHQY
jgi:predicted CxxxxCH...CXXCH cytochrome family protein